MMSKFLVILAVAYVIGSPVIASNMLAVERHAKACRGEMTVLAYDAVVVCDGASYDPKKLINARLLREASSK